MKKFISVLISVCVIISVVVQASDAKSFLASLGDSSVSSLNQATTSTAKQIAQDTQQSTSPFIKSIQANSDATMQQPQTVYLRNYSEKGITKNSFLCHGADGVNFEASDCSDADISGVKGFNFVGGKTVQLFNNFSYWMKQKVQEQKYAEISLRYNESQAKAYLQQQGWVATNAYCIIISTDPVLQKVIKPDMQVPAGKVKVIAQLLYNGAGMLQLWSEDAALIDIGKGFDLEVSNEQEGKSSYVLEKESILQKFLESIDLQPHNRQDDVYVNATTSPRMIRIKAV